MAKLMFCGDCSINTSFWQVLPATVLTSGMVKSYSWKIKYHLHRTDFLINIMSSLLYIHYVMLAEHKHVLARHIVNDVSYLCTFVSMYRRQRWHSKGRVFINAQWTSVMTSAGRFGRAENDSIRFNSIRFDEIVYCLFAFAWTHLHHHMASFTMVMLILFVVSIFVVHINRMPNAGFLYKKT